MTVGKGFNPAVGETRVTLAKIAERAGVHVTTVSLALRNHPRLPKETRQRIQTLAKAMGYAPDPMLRALVSYRANVTKHRNKATLAYVTNWATRWGWKNVTAHPDFYAGALAKANELGYELEHFWLREEGMTQGRLSQILFSRGITGLIIASHGREMGDALQLDWDHLSVVKIDYFPHQPVVHNVTNNQCDIVRLAVQKAIALGYQRIGFVMHRGWDHAVDRLWSAGFLCEQQLLEPSERVPVHLFPEPAPVDRWLNESTEDVVADSRQFRQWFKKHRPEVVISKWSFVQREFEAMGLRIPEDVSFVDVFLEDQSGTVAGVRQNHAEVGAQAVELLSGQLQHNKFGVPEIPMTTYVEGTWFDGLTCPERMATAQQRESEVAVG